MRKGVRFSLPEAQCEKVEAHPEAVWHGQAVWMGARGYFQTCGNVPRLEKCSPLAGDTGTQLLGVQPSALAWQPRHVS